MATTQAMARLTRDEFIERVEALLHHGNAPLALALTDLDNFSSINDTFGREAGDATLRAWERVLGSNLPSDAVVARLGGDEYAVALPGQSAENALILCEEMREHFASHHVEGVGANQAIDASIGIAAHPAHSAGAADLMQAAGEALMRAKREGRGRSAIYVEEKMVLKTTYYRRAALDRLSRLATATGRTEAMLLREALDNLLDSYSAET